MAGKYPNVEAVVDEMVAAAKASLAEVHGKAIYLEGGKEVKKEKVKHNEGQKHGAFNRAVQPLMHKLRDAAEVDVKANI
jgi:hypothetical protein